MTRKKVMVNILHEGTVSAGMETKVMEWMLEKKDKYEFSLFFSSHRPISNNRNQIAKKFLEGDWDYLFMLDDDNTPYRNPFDLLEFDKDVIGGVYPGRDDRGIHFHVYKFGPNMDYDNKKLEFVNYTPQERGGLKQVDAVATGCMCIRRNVLEKIKRPFEDLFDDDGVLLTNDDMHFCIKCSKAGYKVFAHWDYVCAHYKNIDLMQVLDLIMRASQTGIPKSTII